MPVFTEALGEAILRGEVLYLSLCYLLVEPLLRRSPWVNTKRGAYRTGMIAYNAIMCGISLVCFVCTVAAVGADFGHLQWLRDLTGNSVAPLWTEVCPSRLFENKLFTGAATAFHFSKYVEYMDTAWLVLKGKPVIFLHRFHHIGAAWDTWLALTFKFEGLWIFVMLNAFIHTFMYAYYAAAAAGIQIALKPVMTIMQITQFIVGFYMVYPYIHTPILHATTHTHTHSSANMPSYLLHVDTMCMCMSYTQMRLYIYLHTCRAHVCQRVYIRTFY